MFHTDQQTDGRTDMMKLIVVFCNFVNEPENVFDPVDGGLNCLQESSVSTTVFCSEGRAIKTCSLLLNLVLCLFGFSSRSIRCQYAQV